MHNPFAILSFFALCGLLIFATEHLDAGGTRLAGLITAVLLYIGSY
jgi:hypothetical protein